MCAWRCFLCSLALVACGDRGEPAATGQSATPPAPEIAPEGLPDAELAGWMMERGRYADALPVIERVVEARREGGGAELAEALMSQGMVLDSLGESNKALPPLAEAWEIFGGAGAGAETMGACADALGLACHGAGNYEDAERALLAAIEFRQQASPDEPEPWVSASRMHLGRLYLTMARYEEAEALLDAVLASAPDDAAVASRAHQLGSYHHTLGAYTRAQALFAEALAAAGRAFGGESEQAAAIVGDLGLAQLRAGDLAAARASLERSRALIMGQSAPARDLVAISAENLATFYLFVGEPEAALPLLESPDDAVGFNNLGSALQMSGQFDDAAECFERAASLAGAELERHHPLRVQVLQNLACARFDLGDTEGALGAAREAGLAAVDLLDHLLEFGSEAQRLEFRRSSDPLSLLCSFGAPADEIAEMLRRTKGVVLDSLLAEGRSDGGQREVGAGERFADACFYRHYLGRGEWEGRYGAVAGGEWIALGRARQLRTLLTELRAHIDAAASGGESRAVLTMEAVLAGLYDFCIRPLGEIGGGLAYSPDGDLRFVPFAALRDGDRFLSEQVDAFRLVPSGRAPSIASRAAGEWALCAVENYSGSVPDGVSAELGERLRALGNLPGVADEKAALHAIKAFRALPSDKASLLAALGGSGALEVLHFSCHGLFLGDGDDPLARSCLVVEGRQAIYPTEIAALPLDGTRLVTLSACDTGLGVNMAGEGVLGLQRGFLMAGAENILMTLWAVGDRELPEIMADFYRRPQMLEDPSVALWKLQAGRLPALAKSEGLARAVWIAGGFSMLSK